MTNRTSQVEQRLNPDRIEERLKRLAPGAVVTRSGIEFLCDCDLKDNEWGVFDLTHRVYVHHTYDNFIPLISSRDISILITRFGRLPLFFQVMAARLERGLYYQSFSVFGLLYCHQVVRMTQEGEQTRIKIDWYVVSHWLLKFLHAPFNWRLRKLQLVQFGEDAPLRDRRTELRRRGITFITDDPDFLNANDLGDHVILPSQSLPLRAKIPRLAEGETAVVPLGASELLLRREGDEIVAWPALCPHEGGRMDASHLCDGELSCPWHGRKFRGARLKASGEGMLRYLGLAIRREADELVGEPRRDGPAPVNNRQNTEPHGVRPP